MGRLTSPSNKPSTRSTQSLPPFLYNRFEVRKRVFDQYNDYMIQKDRLGEEPEYSGGESQFAQSPPKSKKQQIMAEQ